MKKGDKVSVLDEELRGIIISIKDEQVEIEDEYGFRHWFYKAQLVSYNYSIYEENTPINKEKDTKNSSKKHQKNELKIDLHFEQLVEFPNRYKPWERLLIQKEKLIEIMEYCRSNSVKKLLIIHGLGDGVLQEMVYDVLRGYTRIEYEENDFFKHSSTSVEVIFI